MGKLSSGTAAFIRAVFGREKISKELSASSRDVLRATRQGSTHPGMDADMQGGIEDAVSIDRRLMSRYVDYEEMDEYGDVASALDVYAEDATCVDSALKRTIWVDCQDEMVRKDLDDLFYKTLKMEENAFDVTRSLCKYGNDFEEIVAIDGQGVIAMNFLPAPSVQRVEDNSGNLVGFVQSYNMGTQLDAKQFAAMTSGENDELKRMAERTSVFGQSGDVILFEPWNVVHMRLRNKYRESLYGWGIAEPARWVFKRLTLLEDAMLVYKMTRAPSRYAFYVDVGNTSRQEAERILQEVKNRVKKRKFVNPKTGKLDMRFNPLAFDEDFFLGVRDGRESTRVDVLNGPVYQQIEDVQYFLHKLYAALKVPRAYMGYDENMPSKATLSSEDVRFARSVMRVQREVRSGMKKIGSVHLAARSIDPSSVDFDVMASVPSSIFELGQLEVRRARAEIASTMQAHVSIYWLLCNIYGFSEDEAKKVIEEKKKESAMGLGGEGGGGFGGAPGGGGFSGEEQPGGEAPESGGGEETGEPTEVAGGGFENRDRPRGRVMMERVRNRRGISEREFLNGNKDHEKRIEESVLRSMNDPRNRLGTQLRENQSFLREILENTRRRR